MLEVRQKRLGELTIDFEPKRATIHGPESASEVELEAAAHALREHVRRDPLGSYRPLSGARSLPAGWRLSCTAELPLPDALEIVYPLALVHIAQLAGGQIRVVDLDVVLRRQSGRYSEAQSLTAEGRGLAGTVLCSRCVRVPMWRGDPVPPGTIPCPEPCSVLVALCREAASWEGVSVPRTPASPRVPFAAFDVPGNEVREAYLAGRAEVPG